MADTTNFSVRMDAEIKKQCEALFNKGTLTAMLEAERIAKDPSAKGYTDLDELFADLKA